MSSQAAQTRTESPEPPKASSKAKDVRLVVERPAERPLRVLFAGDSLTYGLFASKQEKGFRYRMIDALSKDGPVDNQSAEKAGAGAADVSSVLDVPSGLDLAIIELGTNDVGAQTPMDEFTKTYSDLLDKIRAKSPTVPLLCVGTWGSDGGGYGSEPYNEVIEAECVKRDGKFVSLYNLYPVEAYRGPAGKDAFGGTSDDFHPNDSGYKAVADLLLASLKINR